MMRGFRSWYGFGEIRSRKLGRFSVVNMDRTPHGSILINDLIFVGDPPDTERVFPTWSQLIRALRRGCHCIDEASFLIWDGEAIGWCVNFSRCVRTST